MLGDGWICQPSELFADFATVVEVTVYLLALDILNVLKSSSTLLHRFRDEWAVHVELAGNKTREQFRLVARPEI